MLSAEHFALVVLIGIGATAFMDVWLFALTLLGVPGPSFALIGRWVGHMSRGQFAHAGIAKAAAIPAELALGWTTHYGIGIAYAGVLIGLLGIEWARQPTLLPALMFGVATVAAPLFVMQPAMGAGIAASRTPTPLKNCLRSAANHAVFGTGLYITAAVITWISR